MHDRAVYVPLDALAELTAAVQRMQAGDLSARLPASTGQAELDALARALNQLAGAWQQREAERQQIEERFRAAFESSAIGMGLLTLDGQTLAANAAVCQMSGYSEAELKQRFDYENVYPPDAHVGMDLYEEMLAGQRGYYSVERRYLRKDGDVFWTRLTLSLVQDAAGQPAYLVAMVEDIDEQKRNSAALMESEARFRAVFENAAVGISLIAPDGRVLAVNPVLEHLSGYSEAELVAAGGQQLTHPDDRDVGRQEFREILAGQRDTFQVEKRYVHRDGRVHWMRQSVSPVRHADGTVRYLVTIAEDVNEHHKAVEELRESEARFKAVFDNFAVGVAIMTLDRRIVQINPTVTRITGYSPEEIFAINPSDMVVEEDRYIDRDLFLELVAGKRDQYLIEKRYLRKDGSLFWGRINFALVRNTEGRPLYIVGMIEDITDEKRAAERLAAQEAEHRRLLEERIAERTEELNQANELLREKAALDAVAAERTRLARELHDAVTQTLFSTTLIADVLPTLWRMNPAEGERRLAELSELTRGALAEMRTLLMELRPNALVEAPLPALLRQLVEAMIGRARIAIDLHTEGERRLPPEVQVGLYRVAQEALNNVVKHAHASQAVVTLRLGDAVRLSIADDGAGFDPGAVTADHLGLRIMRERAEAIGARLSVYSEPGEGTQVSVVWNADT
jgi:PAS domain S-box-containing protein